MPSLCLRVLVRIVALALVLGLGLPALGTAASAGTPGMPLSGRVTAPGGAGVAGAVVTVRDLDRDVVVATATTDADGEYAVAELAEGDYGVLATPPADDPLLLATAYDTVWVRGADEVLDLALVVSNLRGVVSRSDGSPAPGARVITTARGHQEAWAYPDGSYRLAVPAGWDARLRVSPPEVNPALDVPKAYTVEIAETGVTAADLALAQPNLRGRVLAPDETTGVAGATVRVINMSGQSVADLEMASRSDGSFGFRVAPGTVRIAVDPPVETNAEGWTGTVEDGIEVTAEHSAQSPAIADVVLGGPTVTGVVRTPDGDPVPRARIEVYAEAHGSVTVRSDAQGRYGFDLPAGVLQVYLYAPTPQAAYLDTSFALEVPEVPYETDLVFARPNVVGRVVTADGLPVRGADVRAYGGVERPDGVSSGTTDRQGRFGLLLDPDTTQRVVADPPTGFPDGIRTGRAVDVPGAEEVAEVELVLDRPTPGSYDVVPLDMAVDGRPVVRSHLPVISGDGTVVAVRAHTEDECDCEEERSDLPSAASTNPAGSFAGVLLHDNVTGEDTPLIAPNGLAIDTYRLALSSDGQRVAFLTTQSGLVEDDDDYDLDAFVLDRPSNTLHRLAQPEARPWSGMYDPSFTNDSIALSADGSRLALAQQGGDEENVVFFDVAVIELGDTGAETSRQVVDVKSRSRTLLDLSADGSTLAWSEFEEGAWGLHVLDLESGTEDDVRPFSDGVDVFEGVVDHPSLSDDGRYVAYSDVLYSGGEHYYTTGGVRIADRDAGTARRVELFGDAGGPEGSGVEQYELSGDGQSLLVLSPGGHPEEHTDQAWVVDLDDDSAELVSRDAAGRPTANGLNTISAPSDFSVLALEIDTEVHSGGDTDYVALALGEVVPPEWPDGASITAPAGGIGARTLRLQWTEATDNAGVTGYRVFRGDTVVGVTNAETRRLDLSGLTPDTSYTFTVQAIDGRGSLSTDGPSVTVRTLPEDSTELRPLRATARPGGADLVWEAARGADAMLVRTYLGDTQVAERSLDGTATSAQLRGLAADTAYTFQVFARTGETVRPFTERAGVTTPALTFTSLTWTVPTVRPDVAERGSTASITAVADPGRQVTVAVRHLSWYDDEHRFLDTPRSVTSIVTLAETATPGTYTGGFELVDGVARIEQMVGTVADGHGSSVDRASARGPIRVSSRVAITVDAPAESLPGGQLQLTSQATGQWATRLARGAEVIVLDHLQSATDFAVRILDGRGRVGAERLDVAVRDGLATALSLRPVLPASLTVAVRRADGGNVWGTEVELRDVRTDELIGSKAVDTGGKALFEGLQEDQQVAVRVRHRPAELLVDDGPVRLTLVAGANQHEQVSRLLPRTRVSGVVRYEDGTPVAGARVTLTQEHGTQAVGLSATADAAGHYAIEGLALPGRLAITSGRLSDVHDIDLSSGALTRDATLSGPRDYELRMRFFTRAPGTANEIGPVPLDWRTFVDLGMVLRVGGLNLGFGTPPTAEDGSALMRISGSPGQVVEWCLTGYSGGLARLCARTTLTNDPSPTIELRTAALVPVTVGFVDGVELGSIGSEIFRLVDGRRELVSAQRRWAASVVHKVPGPGDYVLEAFAGDRVGQREFSVSPTDTEVSVDDVVLRRRTQFAGTGNEVTASRATMLPGGVVELRAGWRNRSTPAENVVARIGLPAGTTLVPDSLLLDGRSVTGTTVGGYVEVPLGTLAGNATGALRYQLRAADDLAGRLTAEVELRYGPPESRVTEALSPASVTVQGVTVTGPDSASSHVVPLSGRGPAGSVVAIHDGGVPVGHALVGPGGFWSSTVTLAEQLRGRSEHRVTVEAVVEGQRVFAEHVIEVDATRPVPTGISLYQVDGAFPNGRRFDFDPREGVARFPFVFVPNQPTIVEVTFDEPSLVSSVAVLIGSQRFAATRQPNGMFRMRISSSSLSGPIRVDYEAIAKPMDMTQPEQSEAEIRDGVPPVLAGYEITDVQQPDPSGSGPRIGAYTTSVPGVPGASMRSTLTVTRTTYTPTAEDIRMERATGSPMYDAKVTRSGNTVNVSAAIPLSAIPGVAARAEAEGTEMGRQFATLLRNAMGPESVSAKAGAVGVTLGVARASYQLAFTGAQGLDGIMSALGSGDKYEALSKVVDAAGGCSPAKAAQYVERARNLANAAMAAEIALLALNIGAAALAPATMGIGTLAVGMLAWGLDKAIGHEIEWQTQMLAADIEFDDDCKDDEEDDDEDDPDLPEPVADPVWIYDPSGYVYEGARSARIGGVTATLMTAPTADGPWTVWDAEWFGQINPQTTDNNGRYGWDVPEGWWKVVYTKDGYQPASSRVLRVLPPHLDVDVSMVKEGFPHVTGAVVRDGRLEVTFDRLVRSSTAQRSLTVVDAEGADVPGTWSAIGATTGDGDLALQRGLQFTPTGRLRSGARVTVGVDGVTDYSGRLMAAPYTVTLTVPSAGGGGTGGPGRQVPDAPEAVTAVGGERLAEVSWTEPDDNGSELLDYVVTALPSGQQVTVPAGETSTEVDGLVADTAYTFTVTARNEVGTGPASAPSNAVVPTSKAPDTTLMLAPTGFVLSRTARLQWAETGESYVCELDGQARPCSGTGTDLDGLRSGTYTFTVAAVDADGDVDPTPARASWTVPRDDRALDGGPGWQRRRDPGAYDATYSKATARGATLTARVEKATGLALIAGRGRGHGTVAVYLGQKRLATVDLSGAARRRELVLTRTLAKPWTGTVRIVVTSRRDPVRIDGLAVSTAR